MTTARLNRLSSSLRLRTAGESLALAEQVARSRGVIRVVDTTWMDCIGVPVYASIRPDGHDGSLWVHAGKGFTHAEAKIGAYMEAIEFSYIEPGRNIAHWRLSTPERVVRSFRGGVRFTDFAPYPGHTVAPTDAIAVVDADEFMEGLGSVEIPAELVFLPFTPPGLKIFGGTTNGLASGNTLDEATVHALAEVLERDVHSFEQLHKKTVRVRLDSAPPKVREMAARIDDAGFTAVLRYCENEFGLPYFCGSVVDRNAKDHLLLASGYGLHPIREIAAVRALAEAVQSRLSSIHGGREDVIDSHLLESRIGTDRMIAAQRRKMRELLDETNSIDYEEVPDFEPGISSLADVQAVLFDAMRQAGLRHATRVVLSEPTFPFAVVKVVVPGAEEFEHSTPRIGPRLLKHFKR